MKSKVRVIRDKSSAFKIITGYLKGFDFTEYDIISLTDILSVIVDDNESNKNIMKFISFFDIDNHFDEIIALFIMKGRHSLTKLFLEDYDKTYNPTHTIIALESDSIDIAFLMKSVYPEAFTAHEKKYISPLISSFKRSSTNWLSKMYLMKMLIDYTTYIKAEDFLLYVLYSLEKEDPENNPMYYAPNILLFT